MKKTILGISLVGCLILNADFLGSIQKNTSIGGNLDLGNFGNLGDLGNLGNLDGIIDKYKQYGTDKLMSYGTDYILQNEALTGWFSQNSTWATGTMEMCYAYDPSGTSTSTNGDICGLFSNATIDPCSVLPDRIGVYTKLPESERWTSKLALRDWCSSVSGTVEKYVIGIASEMVGISGKTKEEAKKAVFNTEKKNDEEKKVTKSLDQFAGTVKAKNGSYSEKVVNLEKNGKGHVVKNEIKRLAKNTDELDSKQLDTVKDKIVFDSLSEYENDLNAKAFKDAAVEKQLFDYTKDIQTAQSEFTSLNIRRKTYGDKIAYIEKYIEDEKTGKRQKYIEWAERKAEEEIMYEVPKKLDNYYSTFNENLLLSNSNYVGVNKKSKIALINNDIITQQYYEKEAMLKWRRIAEDRANILKNLLIKNALSSEEFDRAAALAKIYQLISPNNQ